MRKVLVTLVCCTAFVPAAIASKFAFREFAQNSVRVRPDGAIGGGGVLNPNGGPSVVFAGTSLKCGNSVISVGTGNDKGNCTGKGATRTCTDGSGNSATASCKGGCGDTAGAGFCLTAIK